MLKINNIKNLLPHLVFISILLFVSKLPVYTQNSLTPKNTFFAKTVHNIPPPDYYWFISAMNQGGYSWQYTNQYTTEPSEPITTFIYYSFLGRIAKLTGISNINMFHLANSVNLLLFYSVSWLLIKSVVPGKKYQWLALFIIFFAGPFPTGKIPLIGEIVRDKTDIIWTYLDPYSRLFPRPHHFFAQVVTIGSVYLFLRYFKEKKLYLAVIGAILLELAFIVYLVPAFIFFSSLSILLGLYFLKLITAYLSQNELLVKSTLQFLKQTSVGWILIICLSAFFIFILRDGTLGESRFNWEVITYNPKGYPFTIWFLFFSLGLLPFFSLFSLSKFKDKMKLEFVLILLMAILPFVFYLLAEKGVINVNKIRFANTSPYVFFAILSTYGIIKIRQLIKNRLPIILIYLIFLVNGVLGLYSYWFPYLYAPQFYSERFISLKYFKVMDFLNKHTQPFSSVLSTFSEGNFLPAFTLNKVYIGHEVGTENFTEKWGPVKSFYNGTMTSDNLKGLLKKNSIEYVLWNGFYFPEKYKSIITPVFQSEDLTLYKIKS